MCEFTDRPIEILQIEDNPGDVRLTREALREGMVVKNLSVVANGEEALAFLRREGPFHQAPRPDVILLDLNLPRKNGREVLAEIKADAAFRSIPVLVLTSSRDEQDVRESYNLHANCFITKPGELHQYLAVIQTLESFWLSVATLPCACGQV